tara:strand:- start:325 stop:516 length:192 start_codon:yes stop_codon:yes gene_type:complete
MNRLTIGIAAIIFVITSLSSCASTQHYQIRKGKVTKQKGTPTCIGAWAPISPYNQRGTNQRKK